MNDIVIIRYGRLVRFEWNEETGLYHYEGSESYAGYTADELSEMDERPLED